MPRILLLYYADRNTAVPLEGCQGDRGINARGVVTDGRAMNEMPLAFMPRKPLDRLEGDHAAGSAGARETGQVLHYGNRLA